MEEQIMTTYANQKVIKINKEKYTSDFLQVGNDEWQDAYRTLKPATFALYLYLASNGDGFRLALSAEAVKNAIGLSKATYHRAVDELIAKGYLNLTKGNIYDFTTTPQEIVSSVSIASLTDEYSKSHGRDKVVSSMSTEIDKHIIIDNIIDYTSSEESVGKRETELGRKQESSFLHIEEAKRLVTNWCSTNRREDLLGDMYSAITNNADGLMGMAIYKSTLRRVIQEVLDDDI